MFLCCEFQFSFAPQSRHPFYRTTRLSPVYYQPFWRILGVSASHGWRWNCDFLCFFLGINISLLSPPDINPLNGCCSWIMGYYKSVTVLPSQRGTESSLTEQLKSWEYLCVCVCAHRSFCSRQMTLWGLSRQHSLQSAVIWGQAKLVCVLMLQEADNESEDFSQISPRDSVLSTLLFCLDDSPVSVSNSHSSCVKK